VGVAILFHSDWTYGEMHGVLDKELFEYSIIHRILCKSPAPDDLAISLQCLFRRHYASGKKTLFVFGDPDEHETMNTMSKLLNACKAL
jgi:hypothetical protein